MAKSNVPVNYEELGKKFEEVMKVVEESDDFWLEIRGKNYFEVASEENSVEFDDLDKVILFIKTRKDAEELENINWDDVPEEAIKEIVTILKNKDLL